MGFKPFSLTVQRARLAVFACVAGVSFWQARTACSRPIEVVPTQGSTISTNVNQSERPRKDFTSMMPGPRRSWIPGDSQDAIAPSMMPPPSNQRLSAREKELLDRRRNWVFMTPDELMSGKEPGEMLGIKEYDKYGNEKEPMTAMERYYEHLLAPDRSSATNQFGKTDSDSWDKETNALTGAQQTDDKAHPFDSPFNNSPAQEVFRPMRPTSFSDVFGTSSGDNNPDDPETIRVRREQESHMDSFKQLWDMGQPAGAASGPAFGNSASSPSAFPSVQPVLGTATPSLSSSASRSGTTAQSSAAPFHATPAPPSFTMPPRRF